MQVPLGTADLQRAETGGEPVWCGEPPAQGAEILLGSEMLISGLSRSDQKQRQAEPAPSPLQQEPIKFKREEAFQRFVAKRREGKI
jgi:hypothetical protein